MNNDDLEARANRIRGMVALLDAPAGRGEKRLRSVIQAVEGLARQLLDVGAADPELKAEIIAWVIRFRAEKERLPDPPPAKAVTVRRPPRALQITARREPAAAPASKHEPITTVFNYDTTDPRTKQPGFIKKPRQPQVSRPSPLRPRPAVFGTAPRALRFQLKLERLTDDVLRAGKKPRGSGDAVLQARIFELYQSRLSTLERSHHEKVGADLEALAKTLGTAISSFRARPGSPGYTPVPEELTFSKGGPVVSGGLPTLGRGRR